MTFLPVPVCLTSSINSNFMNKLHKKKMREQISIQPNAVKCGAELLLGCSSGVPSAMNRILRLLSIAVLLLLGDCYTCRADPSSNESESGLLPTAARQELLLGSDGLYTCHARAKCSDESGDPTTHQDILTSDLLRWLRANGAYINEKLEVRHLVPDDSSSPRGVFATEPLDVGETVCMIPSKLVLYSRRELSDGELYNHCGTIKAVIEAMSGGTITPYGRYMAAQQKGYAPGYWSEDARDLLEEMLASTREEHLTEYDELPPHGISDTEGGEGGVDEVDDPRHELKEECHGDIDNPLYLHAAMMVQTRADYEYVVPFYDMINHHNGLYNIRHKHDYYKSHRIEETGHEVVTTKPIKAGDQIYNSYNHCNVCQDFFDWVGTPEMFLMYGFVEPYPQRWLIDFARVKFDLDWKDGDETTGEVVVTFLVPPSKKGMSLLLEEITRLESFSEKERDSYENWEEWVSRYEWDTLWEYYDALHDALSYAVAQSNGKLSDEVWKLGDDWWVKDGALRAENDTEHWVLPTKSVKISDDGDS